MKLEGITDINSSYQRDSMKIVLAPINVFEKQKLVVSERPQGAVSGDNISCLYEKSQEAYNDYH